MSNWNKVAFSIPYWKRKYSKVEKVFLWILELVERWRYTFMWISVSLQRTLESTNFGFCIRLLCIHIFEYKGVSEENPCSPVTLSFIPEGRLAFPGLNHAASYPASDIGSFPCLSFFERKLTTHTKLKRPLQLTLKSLGQICSFFFFQLYLQTQGKWHILLSKTYHGW